jgi:hypothetical protein
VAVSERAVYLRPFFIVFAAAVVLVLAAVGGFAWRSRRIDEFTRAWIVGDLEQRFHSKVALGRIHVSAFPEASVTGEDLTIQYHNRDDLAPMFRVSRFVFHLGLLGALQAPHRVSDVRIEKLTITIPRRSERKGQKPPWPPGLVAGEVLLDEVHCVDANLIILPEDPGKEPLDWAIHDLVLQSVALDKPFHFVGKLTNAKPQGEIATEGEFGPWNLDEPGDTPVSGEYNFSNANLDPFPGIRGTLSSTGKYQGRLGKLAVEGQTDTPNFSLDNVGKPVPLHTEYSATVDGTNGDTFLHSVRATLVRSLILVEGQIVNVKGQGHDIVLDVSAPEARIQDVLSLALKFDKPLVTGAAKIKAKLQLPPGKTKVLEKMILDGQFGVDDAQWSSPAVREKLEALSRTAEGKPKDEDAGSAISDLGGRFRLEKSAIQFSELSFTVPGAAIELTGSYEIEPGAIDLKGHLRTKAKLSEMTTGAKSFFLKAFDPFFKKGDAGAELPITISGSRDHVNFGVSVFHKTVKKTVSPSTVSSPRAKPPEKPEKRSAP